jgi:CBS domain-containing protein
MRVSEVMTRDVRIVAPDQNLQEAARLMGELDIGALPVAENEKLVGMITDRDITVRAVARGRGPDSPVREAMSKDIKYCYDDQTTDEVTRNMGDIQVRRLPVVDRNKRLVGILSLGDLAHADTPDAGKALKGISERGGEHSQTTSH